MSEETTEQSSIEQNAIYSPFAPAPMILIYSEGKTYLGGFLGFNGFDAAQLDKPLCYVEEFSPHGIQAGVKPVYMSVGPIDMLAVNPSCIYMLDSRNKADNELVSSYKSAIEKMLAAEQGILLASDDEVSKINKVKLS